MYRCKPIAQWYRKGVLRRSAGTRAGLCSSMIAPCAPVPSERMKLGRSGDRASFSLGICPGADTKRSGCGRGVLILQQALQTALSVDLRRLVAVVLVDAHGGRFCNR